MNTMESNARRIVVGVDGADCSPTILRTAAQLSVAMGVPLVIVSCWWRSDIYLASQISVSEVTEDEQLHVETTNLVQRALDRAFGQEQPAGMVVKILYGRPAETLIKESESARLLVLGRRGSGGFLGMRIGSVASACVAHAHCPVLIVNSPE